MGFPSPALDFAAASINLHEHLVHDPPSTYVAQISGDAMEGAGISDGDQILIRRGQRPRSGDVVVAVVEGQFTLRRLRRAGRSVSLVAEHPGYPDIIVEDPSELVIWGVAYVCLHHLRADP